MDKRFTGKAGEEYKASLKGFPNYTALHTQVKKILKEFCATQMQPNILVLEIGCGTGNTTREIVEADDRTLVTAVDNEKTMISQAEVQLKNMIKNGRVTLVTMDALDFLEKQESYSFDAFISAETLHNFPQKYREKVLYEAFRILKPDSIFINADKYAFSNRTEHEKSLQWQLDTFKKAFSKRPDLCELWTKHYLEDDKEDVIMRESAAVSTMRALGFKDIKIVLRKQMDAVLVARK